LFVLGLLNMLGCVCACEVLMLGMLNRLPVCDWNVVDVDPLPRLLKRLVLISTDLYLRIFSELKY